MHPRIAALMTQYPNPQVFDRNQPYDPACYCIGGVLVLNTPSLSQRTWQKNGTFPSEYDVADAIQHNNPRLSDNAAQWYADKITSYNDNACFAEAWALASQAFDDDGSLCPESTDNEED